MRIVEARISGKSIAKDTFAIIAGGDSDKVLLVGPLYDWKHELPLSGNVASVDIVSETKATGGGVTGAAGGAVLGFLLLGPAGSLVGAAAGSQKKGADDTMIALGLRSGEVFILRNVKPDDIARLKALQLQSSIVPTLHTPDETLTLPDGTTIPAALPKAIRGRGNKAVDLPTLPLLERWTQQGAAAGSVGQRFCEKVKDLASQYNTFKWRHFDALMSLDDELLAVSDFAVRFFAQQIREPILVEAEIDQLRERLDNCRRAEASASIRLETAEHDLAQAGFFSKATPRYNVEKATSDIEGLRKLRESLEGQIERAVEKARTSLSTVDGNNPEEALKYFLSQILPPDAIATAFKRPRSRPPSKQEFFELLTKIAKAHSRGRQSAPNERPTIEEDGTASKRLRELAMLFQDGLLTQEEYEAKRSKVLEEL